MKTGFYNIGKLTDKQLKKFFSDAVMLSYNTHIDVLDCEKSWTRQRCNEKTIKEMIDGCRAKFHNVCIDRSIQHETELYGEIGYCTLASPNYFLYVFVTLDNLKELITKYNLETL